MATITWKNLLNRYIRPTLGDTIGAIDEAYLNSFTGLVITDLYSKGVYDIGPLPSQLDDASGYTTISALVDDGFALLTAGIKYFIHNDPITQQQATAGQQITKDKDLVEILHNNYCKLTKGYINIYYYGVDKQKYWLTLLNCGEDCNKEDVISALRSQVTLGVNEYNTSAGSFGVSYLSDYKVDYSSTLKQAVDIKVEAIDFGFAGSISNETLIGAEVDVTNYKTFSLTFISPSTCTVQLQTLEPDGTWANPTTAVTGNVFIKKYALLEVSTIRLQITTTAINTSFELRGTLNV